MTTGDLYTALSPSKIINNENEINLHNNKYIYHYTNLNSLKGIIENKGFFASDSRYQNDPNELLDGTRIIRNTIQQLILNDEFLGIEKEILEFTYELFSKNDIRVYITSFSETDDLLSQWRGYGLNGNGVAIGIPINSLYKTKRKSPFYGITFRKVIYCEKKKISIINEEVKTVFRILSDFTNLLELEHEYVKKIVASSLAEIFHVNSVYFKSDAYHEEQEWRAVVNCDGFIGRYAFDKTNEYYFTKKYRIRNNDLIPYILLDISESAQKKDWILPITTITVGPTLDYDYAFPQITEFLNDNGYNNIDLKQSNLSYRG